MGITYHGAYADLIDSGQHEGYAARKLPSGRLTATWTHATSEFVAYVAKCACGWTGTTQFEPSEDGREAAGDEWEHAHLKPLITKATRAWDRWADQTAEDIRHIPHLVRDQEFGMAEQALAWLIEQLQTRRRVVAELAEGRD
ncbi:hypothetical protein [Lentzea sp. NPDC055074]